MSFMEIFQPGLKHLREEQYRRQMDVAYPTNGGNPPMDIDLDAGTATILVRLPAPGQVEEPTHEPTPAELTHDDEPAHDEPASSDQTPGEIARH